MQTQHVNEGAFISVAICKSGPKYLLIFQCHEYENYIILSMLQKYTAMWNVDKIVQKKAIKSLKQQLTILLYKLF